MAYGSTVSNRSQSENLSACNQPHHHFQSNLSDHSGIINLKAAALLPTHSADRHRLRSSVLFAATHILDLSDELLVYICRYALCPAQGLSFMGNPSFRGRKCTVRCQNRETIAAGLFFANRRLSRIAIPILYGENTFRFGAELRAIMEFLISLGPKSLKRIKTIYLPEPLQADSRLFSWATTFSSQRMSLSSVSIAVPVRMEMDRNYGQLSSTCLRMLRLGRLREVRFVRGVPVYAAKWEGKARVVSRRYYQGPCRTYPSGQGDS